MEEAQQILANLLGKGHGIHPIAEDDVNAECSHPHLGYNVCYIVASVLFNDDGKVLLMQEAKTSCYGKWYLPAGKVEVGESFTEAAKREVLEETGLIMEPTGLITVEVNHSFWMRFVFSGKVVGGSLKTEAEGDKESLQANWFSEVDPSILRAKDILPLIDTARLYYQSKECRKFNEILPSFLKQNITVLRIVYIANVNGVFYTLLISNPHSHVFTLPLAPLKRSSLATTVKETLNRCSPNGTLCEIKDSSIALIGLEHSGSEGYDGIIFNLAVPLHNKEDQSMLFQSIPQVQGQVSDWVKVPSDFSEHLNQNFYVKDTTSLNQEDEVSWRIFPKIKSL